MADYGYSTSRSKPFSADDDVDDLAFLNHPKHGSTGYLLGNENSYRGQSGDIRRMQLQQEIQSIGERTLQSSERSLGLVYESEHMGVATAEELLHQREQLQNVERKVDEVNATLKSTQKHINSIKSIFGGIKNYFSKQPEPRQPRKPLDEPIEASQSPLQGLVEQVKSETPSYSSVHPGLRIRGLDDASNRNLDENDDDDAESYWTPRNQDYLKDESYWTESSRPQNPESYWTESSRMPRLQSQQRPQTETRSQVKQIEAKLDANLDEMSAGLSRLKGLAMGLGDEIAEQNETIGRITDKTETGESNITQQNYQMRRILGR